MTLAHSRRPSVAGSKAFAANHRPGDSFSGQNCYEPSPGIRLDITGRATQIVKVPVTAYWVKISYCQLLLAAVSFGYLH